jgi:cytidine deaminase
MSRSTLSDDPPQGTPPVQDSVFAYAKNDLDEIAPRHAHLLPELVIAFARPQGTNDGPARRHLKMLLEAHAYLYREVQVADLIGQVADKVSVIEGNPRREPLKGYERVLDLMQWGDELRSVVDPSAAAMLAIGEIRNIRAEVQREALEARLKGVAYIVRNLMQPREVALIRSVYKQRFFLVGVYQEADQRLKRLADRFVHDDDDPADATNNALHICEIDAGLRPSAGQFAADGSLNIDNTFHQADVFIDWSDRECIKVLDRWVKQLFGYPFGSPMPEESGMAYAYLAARCSVSLGRSVGAAITRPDGCLLAIGWNEIAQPGGGVYREGCPTDNRDHHRETDPSDDHRVTALAHFLKALLVAEWSEEDSTRLPDHAREWLKHVRKLMKDGQVTDVPRSAIRALPAISTLAATRLFNLIEFGRSVHAEMAAITDTSRRGIPIAGAQLFVTTFPCHECTRNIVASGISKVIYVEPYGKSMAPVLYDDLVAFKGSPASADDPSKVVFEPYVGISPKRFDELFSAVPRKYSLREVATNPRLAEGAVMDWNERTSTLRPSINGYASENNAVDPYFEIAKQIAENSIVRQLAPKLEGLKTTGNGGPAAAAGPDVDR